MNNTCRKCGIQVYDNNIICSSCVQELSILEKKEKIKIKEEKKKKRNEWKYDWNRKEKNWFQELIPISNPYLSAVLFYSLYLIILWIPLTDLFDGFWAVILDLLEFTRILIGEAGASGLVTVFTLIYAGYFLIILYRLIYFIYKIIFNGKNKNSSKNKENVAEELIKLKELLDLKIITKEEFDKKSNELKKIILDK